MKIGNIVTVKPASSNIYLIVGRGPYDDDEHLGKCWLLYNEEVGIQPMHEKWIEVISEGR